MRTITLSNNLTKDIHDTCQHYIDNGSDTHTGHLSQDYEELRDMTMHDKRFKLTVTLEERIPLCSDTVVNILVKHMMEVVDCNEDDTDEMNAFYQYLEDVWNWNSEHHTKYLLKATTPEALEYCVKWLINRMDGDA